MAISNAWREMSNCISAEMDKDIEALMKAKLDLLGVKEIM